MTGSESTPVPYADPEPLAELIEECRCVEAECEAHGVNLHPAHHDPGTPHPEPLVIGEAATHAVDGLSEYGS
jgi:hypothetical protein